MTGDEPAVNEYLDDSRVRAGKALNGRAGSPGAKPVMNWAAREKTELKSRGVSNGLGKGESLSAARM